MAARSSTTTPRHKNKAITIHKLERRVPISEAAHAHIMIENVNQRDNFGLELSTLDVLKSRDEQVN